VRRGGVGVGQQHEELLAAEPAELVLRAQVRRASRARGDEHLVAGLVAVRVVDALEVVEVADAIESGWP
jgi:hypothetical protein